jgi:predicted flap endonuclease-1-like 5' DNA nuclease
MNTNNSLSRPIKKKKRGKARLPQNANGRQNQAVQELAASFASRDDLLAIEGIDPTIEMALNSLGIRRYSDFRDRTPQELSQALQERTGIAISAAIIESQDWIGWAEILAAEGTAPAAPERKDEERKESIEAAHLQDGGHHSTTAEEDTPAIAPEAEQEYAWGEAAEGLDLQKEKSTESAFAQNPELPMAKSEDNSEIDGAAVRIKGTRFEQFETSATADTPSETRLRGEISCELTGAEALTATADGKTFCAQIHALDTATGESELLASKSERLQPNQAEYSFGLEFKIPRVGRYQLQVVALLLDAVPKIDFYQGPLLRVIP